MGQQVTMIWNYSQSVLQESLELKTMLDQLYDVKEGRSLNGKVRTELQETLSETLKVLQSVAHKIGS
ncbi:MAG: hypothetical protein LBI13_01665 [Streptococcaceae bacterium]|jgi:hypothetical protein|nr:hypothetical protein [Streptococcaceae bacterium]